MLRPPFLNSGDSVALVAPARKVDRDAMEEGLRLLKSWDLKIVQGENLFAEHNQFAGDDFARARDLQAAIDIPEIKAVFCARGGYGAGRLLRHLNWTKFAQNPKWIVGMSDITYLHSHVNSVIGVESIQGPMPGMFPQTSWESIESLKNVLFGEQPGYDFAPHELNQHGGSSGILVGGNLSILYALTGTASFPNTNGSVLFIEDLDEYLYHIDRMMLNLKDAGALRELSGVVVGGMTDMNDHSVPFGKTAEEIILEHVAEYNYPVCFGFPAGHVNENMALYSGRSVALSVGDECTLKFL